jgi:arginine:pyruvate transaminase
MSFQVALLTARSASKFTIHNLIPFYRLMALAGDAFGPRAAGHVRISFAVAKPKLAEACERIARFMAEIGRG